MPHAVSASCLTLIVLSCGFSQTFDEASVRPAAPHLAGESQSPGAMSGGPGTQDPQHIAYRGATLKQMLVKAYALERFQVSGPDWLDTSRYDIDATVPAGATPAQFQLMLQDLLADRFRVTVHWKKQRSFFGDLSVAKGGPKLKVARAGGPLAVTFLPGGVRIAGTGSIAMLTRTLENLGLSVEDRTGLTGIYEFDIRFTYTPDDLLANPEVPGPDDFTFPNEDVAFAILGLKLKWRLAPLDALHVDYAEKMPAGK
jgi:uncharacterized protein (TIGR03435 family)